MTNTINTHQNRPATIILAQPRGFCAGVDRAIEIVEKSLEKFGAPVYVRHEIVHNKYVLEDLRKKGAIFVKELQRCAREYAGDFLRPRRAEKSA